MESIYPVLSGALAQEANLDIVANNLSNLNTTGFERDFPLFSSLDPMGASATGSNGEKVVLPAFEMLDGVGTDYSPGVIKLTGEPLDVALNSGNFISVQTPAGVRYTRNGSFNLNGDGQIVTQAGYPVLGASGPITLPQGKITIDGDGRVSVDGAEIDTLQVFQFSDPASLRKTEGTLIDANGQTPVPSTDKKVQQGYLEGSNVNPVAEMVNMIRIMRVYEASQKVIQSANDMESLAANSLGKV